MKNKIPYLNLIGGSVAVTAMIFMAMEVLINDLNLGNLGYFLVVVIAMGIVFFNNYLIVRSITTA